MALIDDIKQPKFTGIYCDERCFYKHYTLCFLFGKITGYNYKLDIAKRVKKCIKHFGKREADNENK